MDPSNGKLKMTAIVRFDHSAAACRGYEINITHAHPAGVSIDSGRAAEEPVPVAREIYSGARWRGDILQ